MFDFVRHRGWFYLISAVLIVPGLISLLLPGGLRPGIDFTSGTIMTVRFEQAVDQAALRQTFADLDHPQAIIQQSSGENTFIVRTRPLEHATQAEGGEATSERERIESTLRERHGAFEVLNLDQVSPLIAGEIVRYAILAVAAASMFILVYLAMAFRRVSHPWRFGTVAVLALIHDALVVLGAFSILGRLFPIELESTFIVAILTVIGFSVHDTIVVFDRVRENVVRHAGESFETIVNHSLTQTIARSLLTSLSVLVTLVVLLVFGGVTIRSFLLALLIGISVGTYSSIFFASFLLVDWQRGTFNRLWPFGRGRGQVAPARAGA